MKQNAVRVALARLAASLLFWLAVAVTAQAADRASFAPIGYSADGQFFAYEEYGIQDGSGFAYSSIYVIDLKADKWTYGTPFDAMAGEENSDESLANIRKAALERAQEGLKPRHIEVPVETLALHGDGETGDLKTMVWSTPRCCGPGDVTEDKFTLSLATQPIASDDASCDYDTRVGYSLTLSGPGGQTVLHKDGAKLPSSRGCTLDYSLYAVLQPFEANAPRVAVVAIYPVGFEGVDRRFIIVPIDK